MDDGMLDIHVGGKRAGGDVVSGGWIERATG